MDIADMDMVTVTIVPTGKAKSLFIADSLRAAHRIVNRFLPVCYRNMVAGSSPGRDNLRQPFVLFVEQIFESGKRRIIRVLAVTTVSNVQILSAFDA